ncbi:MAG: glycosyltransferase family 4 protein [Candidatus Acidiferrales bacterium]|jgi:glycosyltransferase involved in cell wall biosynthesis
MPISSIHIDTRPDWRGGQNQVLLTLLGLRARGHAVELLALAGGALEKRALADGFIVRAIPPRSVRPGGARLLRKIMRTRRIDIIHAHDPHGLTIAWLASAHRRSALVAQRRVANPLTGGRIALARYRAARCIFAVSRFIAESVIRSGIDPQNVEVVYEGVELPAPPAAGEREQARESLGVAANEILLGCVGYLLPEKGQETLILAMPAILREFPNCRLILAGDGPCRRDLESLARKIGLAANAVIFAGFVERIADVYRALDIFLFPSLAEPLGTSMLAAMSYGLPAISVASGGVPEMIEHGRNGLLVAAPDPAAFADATLRLLRSRDEAKRFGAAARATIAEKFTADRMVEATLERYNRILEAHLR